MAFWMAAQIHKRKKKNQIAVCQKWLQFCRGGGGELKHAYNCKRASCPGSRTRIAMAKEVKCMIGRLYHNFFIDQVSQTYVDYLQK